MADDYAKWLADNKVQESDDYDAHAAFVAGAKADPKTGHLDDKYKKRKPKTVVDDTARTEDDISKESARPPKPTDQLGPEEEYIFDVNTQTWIKQTKKV
jgi:hypothetical protein